MRDDVSTEGQGPSLVNRAAQLTKRDGDAFECLQLTHHRFWVVRVE
jgi:hypothetical protein